MVPKEKVMIKKNFAPVALGLIVGILATLAIRPKPTNNAVEYGLRNEINRLNYERQAETIKADYLYKLHFVENATTSEVDSLWSTFGF